MVARQKIHNYARRARIHARVHTPATHATERTDTENDGQWKWWMRGLDAPKARQETGKTGKTSLFIDRKTYVAACSLK
jgi:hypothetical protein